MNTEQSVIDILLTNAARAIVVKDNKILLVTSQPQPGETRKWSMPGGWSEPLEVTAVACKRELYEETGIEAEFDKVVYVEESITDRYESFGNILQKLDLFCVMKISGNDEIAEDWIDPDDGNIDGAKWVGSEEWKTSSNIMAPEALRAISPEEITKMNNCYSLRKSIPERYASVIDSSDYSESDE